MSFHYINSRRPKVGDLVRNTKFGSWINVVTHVSGNQVWLRGCYDSRKGGRIVTRGRITIHEWSYIRRQTRRKTMKKDWASWVSPPLKSSGPKYTFGGYWRTSLHRPCVGVGVGI